MAEFPRNLTLGFVVWSILLAGLNDADASIQLHTNDIIADSQRAYFNGFEGIVDTCSHPPLYEEDNIRIRQINGDGNDIWTGFGQIVGGEGARSWYPDSGDQGYTQITFADDAPFVNVGFLAGSGFGPSILDSGVLLWYELYSNGTLAASGTLTQHEQMQYVGFSGGGFNEIRIRDGRVGFTTSFLDATQNALVIDSIETSTSATTIVPEASSLVVWLLLGVFTNRWALYAYDRQQCGQLAV